MTPVDIILASTSPRRSELLRQIGVRFRVLPSHAPEDFEIGMPPNAVVRMLAERKASAVSAGNPGALVVAADTVISIDGEVLNKPNDGPDAHAMLRRLSGRTHDVLTGVCFRRERDSIRDTFDVTTRVTFDDLSDELIARYVDTGEPFDKAGGYGIQGFGAILVKSLNGSYYNVMGMPLYEMALAFRRHAGITSILTKP